MQTTMAVEDIKLTLPELLDSLPIRPRQKVKGKRQN